MAFQQTLYIQQSDIENVFGVSNVAVWSNLDGTTGNASANTAQVTNAITYASNLIDSYMANSPYVVPLSGDIPPVLTDIIAKLAGYWLYSARGLRDKKSKDEKVDKLTSIRDEAMAVLRDIINGKIPLPSLTSTQTNVNAPFLVRSRHDNPMDGPFWPGAPYGSAI